MAKSSKASTRHPRAKGGYPTREAIALRAYEIYQQRGGAPGHELEDWARAEQELSQNNGKPRRKTATKAIAA